MHRYHARWKREDIIRRIRLLDAKGEPLNKSTVARHESGLHSAAVRRIGSWRAAVEAAGINYDQVRQSRKWPEVSAAP